MLLTMKAYIEAMRAMLYTNAASIDLVRHHPDRAEREARRELVDLLTPISKAWCTDLGVELASIGLQVHGGVGYVEETKRPVPSEEDQQARRSRTTATWSLYPLG